MANKYCYECDGSGWMNDWSSVGCSDPECCSPAKIACWVCNPGADSPTLSDYCAPAKPGPLK